VSGASTAATLRRIVLPLLAPALGLCLAVDRTFDLSRADARGAADHARNLTLPVLIWNMWAGGGLGPAAALTLVMMALMIPLVVLYGWVMRRRGPLQAE
jgi:ABC-type Fe3+ transport system permease subunit